MEKEINGKRVQLDDSAMELFELAIMGSHTRKKLDNLVTSDLDLPDYTRNMVEYFCVALRKLPDPLMAACCTLKYTVVAREMIRQLEKAHLYVPKLVPCSHGILVVSVNQMHIVLQERTWALAANAADDKVSDTDADKMLDISLFEHDKFFKYFEYVDNALENGQRVKNREFLQYALPSLVNVCRSENALRWEMSRLLVFEPYNDTGESKLYPGLITDVKNNKSIRVQLYWTGESVTVSDEQVIVIDIRAKQSKTEQDKRKIYDYTVDALSQSGLTTRLVKSKPLFKAIANLIQQKVEDGRPINEVSVTGLMDDNFIVIQVDGTIAAGQLGQPLKTLCTGGSIINLDKNVVTVAIDKQNILNQVNIRTILNYDINYNTTKTAAKIFSALS